MALKTIIVTRHRAALEWIEKHHPKLIFPDGSRSDDVRIISHATPEDVAGNRVIGILPEELSILTAEYWKLSMVVPAEFRGKELTVEDMERFGCSLKRYWIYDEAGRIQLI